MGTWLQRYGAMNLFSLQQPESGALGGAACRAAGWFAAPKDTSISLRVLKKVWILIFFSLNKVSAAALKSPVGAVAGGRGIQISAVLKTRQVSEQVMGSQKSQGARGCRNPPRTAQQFRRLCCCVLQDFFLKKEKNRYLPCSNSQFPFLRLRAPFSP